MSLGVEGFWLNGQPGAAIQQGEGGHRAAGSRCVHLREFSRAAELLVRERIRDDSGFA
jgi:hypothetical protein